MAKAYKNFWSLNTDEAVVAGILREAIGKKNGDVLMPLNAQMKDVDLVLINAKNKKVITIQVKGSRAFDPKKKEVERYGDGSVGWFQLKLKMVDDATADYFIFLVYVLTQSTRLGRRLLEPHTLTIPTKDFQSLTKEYMPRGKQSYNYYFWVNPEKNTAIQIRSQEYDLTEYLDNKGLAVVKSDLQKI